jgi:hypothetical protein
LRNADIAELQVKLNRLAVNAPAVGFASQDSGRISPSEYALCQQEIAQLQRELSHARQDAAAADEATMELESQVIVSLLANYPRLDDGVTLIGTGVESATGQW